MYAGNASSRANPVVEVFYRLKAQRIDEELRALHAVERGGANQVLAMLKPFHRHLVLVAEEVVVETIGRGESIARYRCEILEHRLAVCVARGDGGDAHVGPAIVEAPITEIGRPQRLLGDLPFPLSIEQRVQRSRGRVCWCLGAEHPDEQHACDCDPVSELHTG